MVKIANGKDASEVALASYFGNVICTFMKVDCNPVASDFIPFNSESGIIEAISYE